MIQVENVTQEYGQRVAVDQLNFTVNQGEILGFLGPNGAGKSTTMNIITGYLSATEGSVKLDGHDILEEPQAVKRRIGYMPELPPAVPRHDRPGLPRLRLRHQGRRARRAREGGMDRAMELLKIPDVRGRLIKNLSKGYKQRVGIAQALIGTPPVLILDEPTIGLDPQQIIETRNLIRDLGPGAHDHPELPHPARGAGGLRPGAHHQQGTHRGERHPREPLARHLGENRLTLRVAGPEREVLARAQGRGARARRPRRSARARPAPIDVIVEAEKDHGHPRRRLRRPGQGG